MKLFLKKILLAGCVFIFSVLLIATLSEVLLSKSNVNYLASFEDKINLIKQNSGRKRIVFVGGSSLTFGLNSKLLADSLHVDVVNLSLHAGIGLNNEIDLFIKHFDKERDIIIISAEFETLASFKEKFDSEESTYCKSLFPSEYPSAQTYLRWIQRNNPMQYLWDLKNDPTKKIGHRHNFNAFGDISNLPPLETKFKFGKKNINFNEQFTAAIQFIKTRMEGFNYYVAAPVINPCWEAEDLLKFDALMKEQFGPRYFIQTTDVHFNEDEFYDTIYHLNEKGRSRRTLIYLNKIKALVLS